MNVSKYRVLLLSEGFGSGHTQAAYALSSSLRKISPNIQTRVLELGSFLNPKVAPLIITAYKKTVVSQPKLVRMMYRSQYKKSINRLATLALHRIFYTHTQNVIRQLRPDIIVCTHPIPGAVISRLKRLGMPIPLCMVITDYDAHGTWIIPEVDRYLVSTDGVRSKLMMRGIPFSKIKVTGIPVHPNFWEHPSKAEIRMRFGLKDMPTVMIMSGGWGMMSDDAVNAYLTSFADKVQFIFCFGSNDKAYQRAQQDLNFNHENIHLVRYTKEIDKLMEVSDLLVTKPGGMTCTEGLAKAIPMLFYNPLPGQEEQNSRYFTEQGWGEPITSIHVVTQWMELLINDYDAVVMQRQLKLEQIDRYNPTECARSIMDMVEHNKVLT
ncbi:UDP-N-acetylglucosamine--LPS N-acetylglucosamine transferase [Paenibacillus bovis]|uniref:UDP-N-acetylglucosamine--LPS N-acetylglucosamine transferase n=1 Tax=Paenibacillus bovis TaxID=1616788 RepID=A0A172ZFT8_9BACL|nr:glycosyltransferase [Paenibacillus bovis]ANF96137.1 UDP-N-acetylglucosamine--LPS N-acetylglucosamine transferase [Paenibacillus bovis]